MLRARRLIQPIDQDELILPALEDMTSNKYPGCNSVAQKNSQTRKSKSAESLRERAEKLLRTRPGNFPALPARDVAALLQELNVYQAELEIQNEELRRSQDPSRNDFCRFSRDTGSAGIKRTCEIDMCNARGSILTMRLESSAFESSGRNCLLVALIDITEKKQIEDALRLLKDNLEQQAHTDELTGLPNRNFFMTVYKQKFEHIKRHFHRLALFMLDLNSFKRINDELGHMEGDHFLRLVAGRMQKACRSGDFLARIGGDEFVLLVEDYRDTHDLIRIAEKIDACINVPVKHAGRSYRISTSIGIARLDDTNTTMELLLKSADAAMYQAKHSGRLYCITGMPSMETI